MVDHQSAPRAFVSYSWTSPTHVSWVLNLATRLREDGVDVILDKWDLKPGHDSYKFMESMVTDPTVAKVVMICDKTYVDKANSREGGVGTESQIISPEIYKDTAQDKFSAVITEEDGDGNAYVPVFYKGRIYFDFRSVDRFEDGYEQLLRWLVDRPMFVKPKLGAVPEAILQARPAATVTQSRAKRAEEAIRQNSPSAPGLIRDYGEALAAEVRTLSPVEVEGTDFDDTIVEAVSLMRPYLRQLAEVAGVAVRFSQDDRAWDRVLAILESLGTMMFRGPDVTRWNSHQFDAYKIVAHEAFLSVVALALDEERFDLAEAAVRRKYLVQETGQGIGPATKDFTVFRQYAESLDHRNRRLELGRVSVQADLLKESHPRGSVPEFESLMQADLVLFIRAMGQQQSAYNWYPLTLVYASRTGPFPAFARAESRSYFDKLAPVLGVPSVEALREQMAEMVVQACCRASSTFAVRQYLICQISSIWDHLNNRLSGHGAAVPP